MARNIYRSRSGEDQFTAVNSPDDPLKMNLQDVPDVIIQRTEEGNEKEARRIDKEFMQDCVAHLFKGITPSSEMSSSFTQDEIDENHLYALFKKSTRRLDFAYILNQQRTKQMHVPEHTFELFCQIMEKVLAEIEKQKDFKGPTAKILMHMACTFYRKNGIEQEFIQNRVKNLPIWKNFTFWTEALFDAIRTERNCIISTEQFGQLTPEEQEEFVEREKNIAFATISAFTHSMLSLSVSDEEVTKFVHKWCCFYSLPETQGEQLLNNIPQIVQSIQLADSQCNSRIESESKKTNRISVNSPLRSEKILSEPAVELKDIPQTAHKVTWSRKYPFRGAKSPPWVIHDYIPKSPANDKKKEDFLGFEEDDDFYDKEFEDSRLTETTEMTAPTLFNEWKTFQSPAPSRILDSLANMLKPFSPFSPGPTAADVEDVLDFDNKVEPMILPSPRNRPRRAGSSSGIWINDHEVEYCPLCIQTFSILLRKHHCRRCGRIFCSKCSSKKSMVPEIDDRNESRVCDVCYSQIKIEEANHIRIREFDLN